jgi:hypothetical protein
MVIFSYSDESTQQEDYRLVIEGSIDKGPCNRGVKFVIRSRVAPSKFIFVMIHESNDTAR